MQSDDDNYGNDQSSYDDSSGDDDEMIHTTASKKESNNQARESMGEDSMFLMFEGESSDDSDDSNDAEDGNDEDCHIYKLETNQNQELYSTSSSSHQSSSDTRTRTDTSARTRTDTGAEGRSAKRTRINVDSLTDDPSTHNLLTLRRPITTKHKQLTFDEGNSPTLQHDICYMSEESLITCLSKHCCSKCCIQSLSPDRLNLRPAFEVIRSLRSELIGLSKLEKEDFIRNKIKDCAEKFVGKSQRLKVTYRLKVVNYATGGFEASVCTRAFSYIYGLSNWGRKKLINSIKQSHTLERLNKRQRVQVKTMTRVKGLLDRNGIKISNERMANFTVALSERHGKARAWMKHFFDLVGDFIPNRNGEIHLDACFTATDIHREYVENMKVIGEELYLSYDSFNEVWDACFPNVKLRVFKGVSGKCDTCAILSDMRIKEANHYKKSLFTELHAFHRSLYMGERQTYYDRVALARFQPSNYMSIILDGMNQNHSKIPYQANLKQFKPCLVQHLQGILEHGRKLTIYRSFHNVRHDRNLAIHSMLLQFEERILEYGKLPPTVFVQVDGGPENCNETFLAVCSLLIHRKVGGLHSLIISRMPPGHTHEDIDSKFGILWRNTRNRSILTPQAYKELMYESLGSLLEVFNVVDLYVVPDYESIFKDCIDPHLSKIWKKGHAKLQWKFLTAQRSEDRVLNLECRYRAFCQDEVFTIVQTDDNTLFDVGYRPVHVRVDEQPNDPSEIINILHHLPSSNIVAKGFVTGSYGTLVRVKAAVDSYFKKQPAVLSQWTEFVQECPHSDLVIDYVSANQLHVPLQDELFADLCEISLTDNIAFVDVRKRDFFNGKPIERVRSGRSAKHSGNLHPEESFVPYCNVYSVDKNSQRDALVDKLDRVEAKDVSRKDLALACKTAGLKQSGNKTELLDRLRKHNKINSVKE